MCFSSSFILLSSSSIRSSFFLLSISISLFSNSTILDELFFESSGFTSYSSPTFWAWVSSWEFLFSKIYLVIGEAICLWFFAELRLLFLLSLVIFLSAGGILFEFCFWEEFEIVCTSGGFILLSSSKIRFSKPDWDYFFLKDWFLI